MKGLTHKISYRPILRPAPPRSIIHEYGEPLEAEIRVYSLEEIVAEKLRAILQHVQQPQQRGWSRSRARDFYDLWRILGTYKEQMDLLQFSVFLRDKCAARHVDFAGSEDFFERTMLGNIETTWNQWLGPLVPGLPPFDLVIGELRPQVEALVTVDG